MSVEDKDITKGLSEETLGDIREKREGAGKRLNKNSKDMESHKDRVIKALSIVGIILLIITTCLIAYVLSDNRYTQNIDPNAAGIVIERKAEREKALSLVETALSNLRSKSIVVNVQDSSQSRTTILYNTHGEAIAESPETGYKTIYMNDHRAVQFAGSLGYGYDSDVVSIMEFALQMAKEDSTIPVLEAPPEADEASDSETDEHNEKLIKAREILIDIRGWDKIKQLYSYVDENFSEIMLDSLKESMKLASEAENSPIKETDELNFRLVYVVGNDEIATGASYLFFGNNDSKSITWDDLSYSWIFEDFIEMYDWKLDEKWYNIDWESMPEWENTDEAEELLLKQYTELVNIMNKFAADNGIEQQVNDIGTSDNTLANATGDSGDSGDSETSETSGETDIANNLDTSSERE